MTRRVSIWLAVWMAGAAAAFAQDAPPPLAAFDEEVAVCRRVIRQCCAIAQDMAKEKELDAAKQTKGLTLLTEARKQWTAIERAYAERPPAEYARDPQFKARLRDIGNALEDMERALAAGDPRRSMLACGFACGQFTQMHEQNGLHYALDKLFHLRMDIRTTQAVFHAQGLAGVRPRLAALLQKRDAALLAPPPFAADHPKAADYAAALDELSRALDRLALAAAAGDEATVREILDAALTTVNKPYGIAL